MDTHKVDTCADLITGLLKENRYLRDKIDGLVKQRYTWLQAPPDRDLKSKYWWTKSSLDDAKAKIRRLEQKLYDMSTDLLCEQISCNGYQLRSELFKRRLHAKEAGSG